MGSEGLEPSLARVGHRREERWSECAAANTLIPRFLSDSPIGSEGVEPSSGSYKGPALTVELRAVRLSELDIPVGPEGIEPSPARLKVCCAAFTPRPRNRSEAGVSIVVWSFQISSAKVEWPEVESNHRCRRIRATCFRYNTGPQIGVARIELRSLVLPTHAGHHYPSPRNKSERPDSNRRSPGP